MTIRHSQLYISAVHEAAHAVVRIARGLDFTAIEIYTDPRAANKYGYMHVEEKVLTGDDSITMVLSTLASIPAERLLRPHRTQFYMVLTGCKNDFDEAAEFCGRYGLDTDYFLREASRMVRRLAPSIYRVADALEEEKRLSYEAVLALCPEAIQACEVFTLLQNKERLKRQELLARLFPA